VAGSAGGKEEQESKETGEKQERSGSGPRIKSNYIGTRPKIFAFIDFCTSLLTIHLIRKNCENVIYFTMTCFIIIYILSIS
jgi:hypothetical protein